ncbi:MAG: 5'-nucleotidase C-terminal domain-containing protein [Thermodesulfobacteriota bacterium]
METDKCPVSLMAASMLRAVFDIHAAMLNYDGVAKSPSYGRLRKKAAGKECKSRGVRRTETYAATTRDTARHSIRPFFEAVKLPLIPVDLSGTQMKQTLEDDLEYLHRTYDHDITATPCLAGALMSGQPSASAGSRIQTLSIRDETTMVQPMQEQAVDTTVVKAFVAGGHDGFLRIIGNTPDEDTGVIDSDAFLDYLKQLGTFPPDAQQPASATMQHAG